MTFVVGLTGGIASGKTTVANLFHDQFNIDIIDADVVAREVVEKGSAGLASIAHHFGQDILEQNGQLNRAKLRERIFSHPDEKKWLDSLMHPLIRDKMQQDLSKVTTPYALLVVPLLIENQLQFMADRILVVDVSLDTQIKRTMKRDNVPKVQVESILSTQASREQRIEFADDIILNDDDNHKLLPQITKLHNLYIDNAAKADQ